MKIKEVSKTYAHIEITEAKKHCNISDDFIEDDGYITGLIAVATEQAENLTETPIALTVKKLTVGDPGASIEVPDSNYFSVDSITADGATVDPEAYRVDENINSFLITFNTAPAGEVVINYKVGFDADNIKPVLKQAILVKVMDLYDVERSGYNLGSLSMNRAFESMLQYYRKLTFI